MRQMRAGSQGRQIRALVGALVLGCGSMAPLARAQCPAGTGPFTSLYPIALSSSFRQLGYSCALLGDLALVADNFDGSGSIAFSGAGFIWRLTPDGMGGQVWALEATLKASDAASMDQLGVSSGLTRDGSDELAVLGASLEDNSAQDAGSVYVFVRAGGGSGPWVQEAKVTAPDGAMGDNFGSSIAIEGPVLVVGSPGDDDLGSSSGSVYVFVRTAGMSGGFTWTFLQKLTAPDAFPVDQFGLSVALRGDDLFIGAPLADAMGGDAGSVYHFARSMGGAWVFNVEIAPPGHAAGDSFGRAVSTAGGILVAGSPGRGSSNTGGADVFRIDRPQPGTVAVSHEAALEPTMAQAQPSAQYGFSLAYADGIAIIGAHSDDAAGLNAGALYMFERRADGTGGYDWLPGVKFITPFTLAGDDLGYSVATTAGAVLACTTASDRYGLNRGDANWFAAPAPPLLDGILGGGAVIPGDNITLTAATGLNGPFAFIWKRNGVVLVDGGRIGGATTQTITITSSQPSDSGVYEVVVTTSCGDSSAVASVTVGDGCTGDADGNGAIEFGDVAATLANFGTDYSPASGPGDADRDGDVDFGDIAAILANFGVVC